MGFLKTISTDYGVDITYWNIKCTWINWRTKFLHVELQGFKDENSILSNPQKTPLMIITYNWEGDDFFITYTDNVIEKCYEKIKLIPEWEGAIDAFHNSDIYGYSGYSGA